MKHDRNEPCHCGSGKKYKNCHGRKSFASSLSGKLTFGLLGIVVGAGGIVLFLDVSKDNQSSISEPSSQLGVAPPGKVWSDEHGHWHDAADNNTPTTPLNQQLRTLQPQPSGLVPEGKVWSPEHGHWHDAMAGSTTEPPAIQKGSPPYPQPSGPVPEGKVWSPEHGHWHDAPPKQ